METCHEIRRQLTEYVDEAIDGDVREAVARHLAECASCRGLAADLADIRHAARGLGPIAPPDHAWIAIAGQLRLGDRAGDAPAVTAAPVPWRRRAAWQWLGLAAGLVVVSLAAYLATRASSPTAPVITAGDRGTGNPAHAGSVESVADELQQAAAHYEVAIQQLEALANDGDQTLSPAVATTLQRNLTVIDHAIVDSRRALQAHPESEPARASLFEALRRKVSMLQTTVALMNEMRKGDAAGALKLTGRKSSS